MAKRPPPARAANAAQAILQRIEDVGGSVWGWGGKLRFRPLSIIPDDLIDEAKKLTPEVIAELAVRSKPKRQNLTEEKRYLARVKADLTHHAGSSLTEAQRMLIDRACWLSWHVRVFDRRAIESGGLSAHASREYLAYSNSLERVMIRLEDLRVAAKKEAKQAAGSANQWASLVTSTTP